MRADTRLILTQCLDHVADAFARRLHGLGAALAAALEARAQSEPSAERRKLLASLRVRVGEGWEQVVTSFDEAFRHHAAIRAGWRADNDADLDLSLSSLRLLDDEQVEWDLAFGGAISRMKAAGGAALSEFEQRIYGLTGATGPGGEAYNPINLDVAGLALKLALEQLLGEPGERRALLVHLDSLLVKEASPLFDEANTFLAERGVELPARARPLPARPRPAAGDGAASDVFAMLQKLVQTTPGVPPAGGAALSAGGFSGGGGLVAVPAAVLESLNTLQAADLGVLQSGRYGELPAGGNVLRELRQQEFARQLPPIDAATIDIVAMLFDFIFDDKLIPDTIKALVGRLQIPLLKVAMLDKSFFSNREHPARALLDTISRLSIAAGKSLDHGEPVFEKIKAAVNRVLAEFEKEQKVFAELLAELQALLAEQERRTEDLAERSKRVAEKQEQGDLAEVEAADTFARVLKETLVDELPSHIGDFLSRHWTSVLKFALLKGGVGGHPWALALQTLSDLLWTLTPKSGVEDRQRLISMLPDLLRRVNAYLDRVGVSAAEKAPFLDALVEIHSAAIKGARRHAAAKPGRVVPARSAAGTTPAAPEPTPEAAASKAQVSSRDLGPSVVVTRVFEEGGVEVESMSLAGKVLSSRPVRLAEVGNLQRGDWVEFNQENGTLLRGRLSWVSPQRGIMLFTNPQSARAISISPEALAVQMKRGLAVRLDEAGEALIDRALGKAMGALKTA